MAVVKYRLFTESGIHIATVTVSQLESAKAVYEKQYGKITAKPVALKDNRW